MCRVSEQLECQGASGQMLRSEDAPSPPELALGLDPLSAIKRVGGRWETQKNSWLRPGPAPNAEASWGVSQRMEDIVFLSLSLCLSSKKIINGGRAGQGVALMPLVLGHAQQSGRDS